MKRAVLATAADMPKPDLESHLLVAALEHLGITARIVAWDAPFDWSTADLVVIRTTWDYYRRLDEFISWADSVEAVTCLVNPASVIRWNAHKSYMVELTACGVPTVPTRIAEKGTRVENLAELFPETTDIVIKPAVSIGAIGALRGHVDDPTVALHLQGLLTGEDVLIQPFMPAVIDTGEVSLLFAGDELSHAVSKRPCPGDYRVQDHHGGTVHPHQPTDAEIAVASAAISRAPATCAYARVDLVSGDAQPVVMELELIEPALFLAADRGAPDRFAGAFVASTA
jgi:glutathione synthase/RimK-type ligase-like ATP-grasp enzyme